MSEETSKELNIPLSVKQAKLCFERSLEMPNSITAKRSENNMNVSKRAYRNEPAVLPENNVRFFISIDKKFILTILFYCFASLY